MIQISKSPNKTPLSSIPTSSLSGEVYVPGDKSISHRAVMISSIAEGTSRIYSPLMSEDVIATIKALSLMGAKMSLSDDSNLLSITGVGPKGLSEPSEILNMSNSGTSTRLLMGLVSSYPIKVFFSGDSSLNQRPMSRVIDPLSMMGASFSARQNNLLPLMMEGNRSLKSISYTLPVASAQVKSAIMLAALNAEGTTTIFEHTPTRNHTETMLPAFGCHVSVESTSDDGNIISITGKQKAKAVDINIPGDISSAAFPMVSAIITPDSTIRLKNVGINPSRTGILTTLIEMGANIHIHNKAPQGGEEVSDIDVSYSKLRGVRVPIARVPSMIDEFPILAVAASFAKGETICQGLSELRVKESDRLTSTLNMLLSAGVKASVDEDSLSIIGDGSPPLGGGFVKTHLDHRIAMSSLIMGIGSRKAMSIDNSDAILSSFPSFQKLMSKIGACFK